MNPDSARRLALQIVMLTSVTAIDDIGAQASELRGRILTDSGVPVRGATITIVSVGYSLRSDSLGAFRLTGTPGTTGGH